MNQLNYKSVIPALVASGVLFYESVTGDKVSESQTTAMINGLLIGAGLVVNLWGVYHNHQKKPPDQTPSVLPKTEVHIKEETQPKQANNSTPIVTQDDLNRQISK